MGANRQLGWCIVSGTGEYERVLQKGQFVGYLFPLLSINSITNKITSVYSVFCTFDILLCLKHLAELTYSEFCNLLARRSSVFSCNMYEVGIKKEENSILLDDGTPIRSYIPCHSPLVIEAVESKLEKLEKANLIEPSNNPYSAPTICERKLNGSLLSNHRFFYGEYEHGQ